ncbi:MAG: hypothetical protein WCC38_03195 [Pseudonocardiaceae bacterium]
MSPSAIWRVVPSVLGAVKRAVDSRIKVVCICYVTSVRQPPEVELPTLIGSAKELMYLVVKATTRDKGRGEWLACWGVAELLGSTWSSRCSTRAAAT